jgi:NAD(P)H dehydrogenase (quinone)
MRVLLIYCHPRPDSFSAALRDRALAALTDGGHAVDARDLYAEHFDPALSPEERGAYFDASPHAQDVAEHIASLRRAEALLLIYPTWWFGMPALLKGWLDRIWLPEVAFRLGPPPKIMVPLLTNIRRIAVVTTYGMPRWMLWWVGWPDRRIVRHGLKPLCARGCRIQWLGLTGMDTDDPARRRRFLEKVTRILGRWR